MFSSVYSGAILGVHSYILQIETDISDGLPTFTMVGFLSAQVKEAGERVRVALRSQGFHLPAKRITVNCMPADLPKRGLILDLPVAVSLLSCLGEIPDGELGNLFLAGGLSLDGEVTPVRGVLPMVLEAKRAGLSRCILPADNVKEGASVHGMTCIGVHSLADVVRCLTLPPEEREKLYPPEPPVDEAALLRDNCWSDVPDFGDVRGQEGVKRGMEIAAAGFHNLLMVGPPGSGKSMMAKCLPGILPPLTPQESLEVSSIYSIAGELPKGQSLITKRPFLAPHHTITPQALTGGGSYPKPGSLSLAHRGVLFLDELPEFGRDNLNILRQPLEDHRIIVSRSTGNYEYPTRFMLVAAMNPCPCGYYPDREHCSCSESSILRYMQKVPGPILDRFDLCLDAPRVPVELLMEQPDGGSEKSAAIRERVLQARERQRLRFIKEDSLQFNADMSSADVERYCALGRKEKLLIEDIFQKMNLSARAYHRILKVARTIADLDMMQEIREEHLMEAIGYRSADRGAPGKEGMVSGREAARLSGHRSRTGKAGSPRSQAALQSDREGGVHDAV